MEQEKKNLYKRVAEYLWKIERQELRKVSLRIVSERFGIAKYEFSKKFNEIIGVSFLDFIDSVKMRRAEAFVMSRPDLTIGEIALIFGIRKRQRFSEKFKKVYGMNPSEFRKCMCEQFPMIDCPFDHRD